MSETIHGDDSMLPNVGFRSSFFEVKSPEIPESSSLTTTDGMFMFSPFKNPWLIFKLDIQFNQNYSNIDYLTDNDDDLPSLS